jgi:siderophore synthetase component
LPHAIIPYADLKIYLAAPSKDISKEIFTADGAKFFVHPETLEEITMPLLEWSTKVQPTSSTRTVVPKGKDYALKLHLNKRLSRYIRRLSDSSTEHSILISSELEKSLDDCPASFGFLPETIGISYKDIGMIVRELTPRPYVKDREGDRESENRILMPLFSLYSVDLNDKDHEPFFLQLIRHHQSDPLEFFIEYIVRPIFENMSYYINNHGLLLESHGQNILVELDDSYNIKRMVHRDFQSIYIDKDIRKAKGLEDRFQKHIMGVECQKELSYGLVYDQYFGRYVMDNFVSLISSSYGIREDKIIGRVKEMFHEYFDASSFPKDSYYMMDKKMFTDNNTVCNKYNERPKYR